LTGTVGSDHFTSTRKLEFHRSLQQQEGQPLCPHTARMVAYTEVIRIDGVVRMVPLHVVISGRLYTSTGGRPGAATPPGTGASGQSGERVGSKRYQLPSIFFLAPRCPANISRPVASLGPHRDGGWCLRNAFRTVADRLEVVVAHQIVHVE
jgi:hypothetical protein